MDGACDEGLDRKKAVYLATGVRCSGHKGVPGLWIEQTEGARLWLRVMNGLKAHGIGDIMIAVVQTCIVHLIRNSRQLASRKDRKALAQA